MVAPDGWHCRVIVTEVATQKQRASGCIPLTGGACFRRPSRFYPVSGSKALVASSSSNRLGLRQSEGHSMLLLRNEVICTIHKLLKYEREFHPPCCPFSRNLSQVPTTMNFIARFLLEDDAWLVLFDIPSIYFHPKID